MTSENLYNYVDVDPCRIVANLRSGDITSCIGDGNRCANNGTCEESFGYFTCVCQDGYKGHKCEIDHEKPVIDDMPANIIQDTDPGMATAIVSWTSPTGSDNSGSQTLTSSHTPDSSFPIGVTRVTYNSTDDAANTVTSSFTVTIKDHEKPVIDNVPENIIQDTDPGMATAIVTWTSPTGSDNSGSQTLTSSHTPDSSFPIGVTTVTYNSTDDAGNTVTSSFTVTIQDREKPVIGNVTANIIQDTSPGLATAIVTWTSPTGGDNSGSQTMTSSHTPGSIFPIGVTTVTYKSTDDAGNTATSSFTVTIKDHEKPIIDNVPANIIQDTNPGMATAIVTWTSPTGIDNSDSQTLTSSHIPGSSFPIGVTIVTYNSTDEAGNEATFSFIVTIQASWSFWGSWSSCSRTCGGGIMYRNRTCGGSDSCPGSGSDSQSCSTQWCYLPLGLADGRIEDNQMTASSFWTGSNPWKGRLHNTYWWASSSQQTSWLQVDFLTSVLIKGIQTQGTGHDTIHQWVTRLTVSTGSDVNTLKSIEEADGVTKSFAANVDTNSVVDITFPELITARILRVYAIEWYDLPSMRMEVIGHSATCEDNWELFGYYCYQATRADISFHGAEDVCQTQSSHLASIHNQDEQKFIKDLYNNAVNYWIGLTDVLNEDTFVWNDNSTVDYKNWGPGQPDGEEQDCVMAHQNSGGLWHDVECDYSDQFGNMAYVCKKDAVQNTIV
ncbi:uncharacterized protein [Amphiura filiformis]|uniref:uncharacterized protein n=1 Tax=Amphiura filiformis TaxID=82378 RepID=UPI003B211DEB